MKQSLYFPIRSPELSARPKGNDPLYTGNKTKEYNNRELLKIIKSCVSYITCHLH